jgi:septal ring factor EnvC (AmiA/AmiB activator)
MLTESTTISIGLLLVIGGLLVNIIVSVSARKHADEAKHLELEKNFVKQDVKLDTISNNTISLAKDFNRQAERTEKLTEIAIQNSERITTLFNRLDDHEERITKLEGK